MIHSQNSTIINRQCAVQLSVLQFPTNREGEGQKPDIQQITVVFGIIFLTIIIAVTVYSVTAFLSIITELFYKHKLKN